MPHQHEAVLDQRQFVLASGGVGDQHARRGRAHLGAVKLRRAADRPQQPVAIHARHEILRAIDGFGESVKARAFAQEFRAHGDDDMDGGLPARSRCGRAVVSAASTSLRTNRSTKSSASSRLVSFSKRNSSSNWSTRMHRRRPFEALERTGNRGQRRPAAVELADDLADALDIVGAAIQPGEFLGQVPQWPARRPHGAGLPRRPGAQMLPRQLGQHAGAHQRRFSGAGSAVNQHQAMGGEPLDHVVDHALAAEEDRPFFGFERPQARDRDISAVP